MAETTCTPQDVLDFWIGEIGPERWYATDPALDALCRERFADEVEAVRAGAHEDWILKPKSALALLILLDQLPRNIWRGEKRAFCCDGRAVAFAKRAIHLGHDMKTAEPERQFFYVPLMHTESQMDQDRCVRLILTRMPETGDVNLKHAVAHRDIIREFGRFPFRNQALKRHSTPAERSWLSQGGYQA